MNVEIGAEAAQFPEKEYIIGIAVAVHLFDVKIPGDKLGPAGELSPDWVVGEGGGDGGQDHGGGGGGDDRVPLLKALQGGTHNLK